MNARWVRFTSRLRWATRRGSASRKYERLLIPAPHGPGCPKDILDRLGHKPARKRRLQTADNRIIERDAAFVPVRIGDETNPSLCIFGDVGSIPLLGATTMQEFSLAPDPVKEKLVPTVGVLAKLLEDD